MFHLSPLSLLPSLLKLSDFDKVPGVLETGAVCVSTQILSGCHLVHSTLHSRSLSLSLSLSSLFLFPFCFCSIRICGVLLTFLSLWSPRRILNAQVLFLFSLSQHDSTKGQGDGRGGRREEIARYKRVHVSGRLFFLMKISFAAILFLRIASTGEGFRLAND